MERPSLHLCIATGQNLANLIPAIDLGAREVIILETDAMHASAKNLQIALQAHGIEVKRLPFNDTNPVAIVDSAQTVALELGEHKLVFNATGGHKLMTLALTKELHELAGDNLHLLYCETRYDRLDWLQPNAETQPMKNVLKLKDILLVQGYRIKARGERDDLWKTEADRRASLTRTLGDSADKFAGFIGTLNWLADEALNEPDGTFRPRHEFDYAPGGRNAELLCDAKKLGLLDWKEGDTELVFSHPEAARYFRGGWLEEYAWLKLRGLEPDDFAVNLCIEAVDGKTDNELDAVIAHRNRLLIIECKSKRFGRDHAKDSDHVYKLAQLAQQTGGIMGKGLLLSARAVGDESRKRAQVHKVDVLSGGEIKGLVDYLKRWMGG